MNGDEGSAARTGNDRPTESGAPGYRRVLWIALAVNALMFLVEVGVGVYAGSLSLQADALDFFGDASNYALSLWALSRPLRVRASVALFKGAAMGSFGVWVLAFAVLGALDGQVPLGAAMGVTALAALVANVTVTVLLYRYRHGDSNMRSVWLCTRNDVLINFAVLLAASGVVAFDSRWPDLLVAAGIASLALVGAVQIVRHARAEQRSGAE